MTIFLQQISGFLKLLNFALTIEKATIKKYLLSYLKFLVGILKIELLY